MTIQDRIFLAFIPLFLLIATVAVFFIYTVHNNSSKNLDLSNCLAYLDGKSGNKTLGEIFLSKNSLKIIMPRSVKLKKQIKLLKKKMNSRSFIKRVIKNGGYLREGNFFIFLKKKKQGYLGVFGINKKHLKEEKLLLGYLFTISIWMLIIILIISMYISKRLSKPLRRISDHFKLQTVEGSYNEINRNDFRKSSDEIKILAKSYNKLILTLKSLSEASLKNERLVVMGQLTAEMAHEIRNPLNAMVGAVEILKGDGGGNKYIELIEDKIAKIDEFIKETLMFSRKNKSIIEKVNLKNIINEIVDQFKNIIEEKSIEFIINDCNTFPLVAMTNSHAYQIIYNIVENAVNAVGDNPIISIDGKLVDNNYLCLEISDNGVGIKEKDLKKVFEPFFRISQSGTGLGLAIVKRLIEEYGGSVEVSISDSINTVFKLYFPIYIV